MADFPTIPPGYGYPLVTMANGRLPQATMDAIAESPELTNTFGTVTLTVSAADTPLPFRTRADYQCDGTGDIATIQAALDALPDDNAVSGEVVLLPGNYTDATGATLSIGSPSSASLNPRKVLRFVRGARLNVSGRTGRLAVIKVESPDCQVINPNIAGNASFGNGTGIAIGGDVATLGGRWSRVCNRVTIESPILSNLETGIEFSSIDGGPGVGGSTGDCNVFGGYIFQNKTGIRAAGYTNSVYGTTLANNNKPVWVEARRVEAQLRCYGITIVGWNEVGILVDGGFGSVFHDTWMEHVSATGSTATEAIRLGASGTTRAHLTRFTGTTHVQLVNEQYAVRYVGAVGTLIEDLVISTSGAVPSVAAARNELPSACKRNRIQRLTYGPAGVPTNTPLSIDAAAWGEVFIDRIPGVTGDAAFSTRINSSTRASSSPSVRKPADTSRANTDTLTGDSDMTINLSPGTRYRLTGLIIFDAPQTADFKMALSLSGGATIQWSGLGPVVSHASADGSADGTFRRATSGFVMAWGGAGAGVPVCVQLAGDVVTTDLASMTMTWAQNTADATPTILKVGSWIALEPVA